MSKCRTRPGFFVRSESVLAPAYQSRLEVLGAGRNPQGSHLWDLTSGRQTTLPGHAKELDRHVSFSPDGKWLLVTSRPDTTAPVSTGWTARVWDLAAHRVVMTIENLAAVWNPLEFSPGWEASGFY
jgi:WD40 repeat protein